MFLAAYFQAQAWWHPPTGAAPAAETMPESDLPEFE
jgi:hypothetical protein